MNVDEIVKWCEEQFEKHESGCCDDPSCGKDNEPYSYNISSYVAGIRVGYRKAMKDLLEKTKKQAE